MELAQRGTSQRVYRGWVDCMRKNLEKSGFCGLQNGLMLGIVREFFFNGVRLGLFEPLVNVVQSMNDTLEQQPKPYEKLLGGLAAGSLGGLLINPIDGKIPFVLSIYSIFAFKSVF